MEPENQSVLCVRGSCVSGSLLFGSALEPSGPVWINLHLLVHGTDHSAVRRVVQLDNVHGTGGGGD